jgi:hypothetical protein
MLVFQHKIKMTEEEREELNYLREAITGYLQSMHPKNKLSFFYATKSIDKR